MTPTIRRVSFLIVLCLGLVLVVGAEGEFLNIVGSTNLSFSITDAGDTAQITKYTPTAFDSFTYSDSFSYEPDTTAHQTISWTSPVQTMIITPTVDVATTYSCSVDFVTGATVGVEKDYASGVATLAAFIDTLVDMINLKAVLTDSVTAEDSATYIKLVSNFSGGQFGGRWSMVMVTAGGTGTLDSAAHVSQATVPMICDTMVAKINADAGLDSFVTASDSATYYMVTADKKGILFFGAVFGGTGATLTADSLQDTVHTQANVTSISSDSGTVSLDAVRGFKHLDGRIVLSASYSGYAGLGNEDSAIVTIYTTGPHGRFILAVDTCASPPCTCNVMLHSNVGDTLLRRQIEFHWYIDDTVSDTTLTVYFPAWWDLQLK